MKARPLETASGKPGPAGRSGRASFSTGPSPRTTAAGAGTFVSGAPGAALLAAALLLAPGEARADAECGISNQAVINCNSLSYSNGIQYGGRQANGLNSSNSLSYGNGPVINILGRATGTTTITAATNAVGIKLRSSVANLNTINVGGETNGVAHVINIVQGTNTKMDDHEFNNGIWYRQRANNEGGPTTMTVKSGVTIGSASAAMEQHGILVRMHPERSTQGKGAGRLTLTSAATIYAKQQGIRVLREQGGTNAATTITNTGAIHSGVGNAGATGAYFDRPHGLYYLHGGTQRTGSLTVDNDGDITLGGAYTGILLRYWGAGAMSLDNSGNIGAVAGQTAKEGIRFNFDYWENQSAQAVTLTNSGDIRATDFGIRLKKLSGGAVELTNRGAITVTGDAAQHVGHAIYLAEGVTFGEGRTYAANGGDITVDNSGALRSKNHALYVYLATADDAIELTNTGTVTSEDGDGIRIERVVEGDVTFVNGGMSTTSGNVSGKGHGIYIGKAARIDVDQSGGTISGRTGVYAEVTRSLTTGGTRSMDGGGHDPAIDIDWTGGSITRGTATTDNGRFAAASAAQVLTFDQEAEAVKAVAGSVRWGSAAGIEAHALSWRDVVAQVAKGDDPGEISAGAGGLIISGGTTTTAVPATATASNAYIAQFKAALANMDLDVASAVLTAIGTTATTAVSDLTDAQIRTYLRTNNGATRTLLRNILAQGLSDKEKAVLRAVAAGDSTALTTALDDTAAAFSNAYKTAVRALLDRYNLDDIRVSMTGGSIDSHGDGIRAYYATVNDNNGGIDVTIAAGATVSGGVNGILVSGSGTTMTGTKNQEVTVAGRVEGGTGAGVHLVGGGTVTVGTTGVVVATSGTAITTSNGGDLTADISGRVEGDIRAAGALTLTSAANSVITGTVYNPVSPLTVAGSIGRLLYTAGGTVTVASTGALTGVSGQTTAIQSSAGALDVTVNSGGTVTGNILAAAGGALSADIAGTVNGDIQATGGGALTFTSRAGSRVSGTVHDPTGSLSVAGSIGRLRYTAGGTVSVASTGALTGVSGQAIRSSGTGALDVTVNTGGTVTGNVLADGSGALSADIAGTVNGDIQATGSGALTFTSRAGSRVSGTVHDPTGSLSVAGSIGRLLYTNGGTVSVASGGAITGVSGQTAAIQSSAGALAVTVASGTTVGGAILAGGGALSADIAGTVNGDIQATGGGALTFMSQTGSRVTGTVHDPTGSLSVAGSIGRLLYTNGGTVSVASTGAITGVANQTTAIQSSAGALAVTVASGTTVGGAILAAGGALSADIAGTVNGDIQATGGGALTFMSRAGSRVTGTVHDPTGSLSVAGSIGRLLYTAGGTVSVASGGAITGVANQTTAIQSSAGALAVTVASGTTVGGAIRANGGGNLDADVAGTVKGHIQTSGGHGDVTADIAATGRVEGDIQASGTGTVTLTAAAGSEITGTVHDLTSAFNTVAGSIGRLLYTNGGAVTVVSTGTITGVRGETEAIRSSAGALSVVIDNGRTVGGAIRANGGGDLDVDVDVAGTVGGALLADGGGNLDADVAGTVKGAIQTSGGNGNVTAALTETGRVEGDIQASGTGTLTLTAPAGSVITGTVHNPTSAFTTVAGTIGRLLYTDGATVTVAQDGQLTGVEGEAIRSDGSNAGHLSVMIAAGATVGGDIRGLGDGNLTAEISGWVDGDVVGSGGGEHMVTVPVGGTVTGTVHLDGSTVTVDGTVGRSIIIENSGTVTVGPGGTVGNREAPGDYGIRIDGEATIVTHGTVQGKNGIRVGRGSTVTAGGTIRSTDGPTGDAFRFVGGKDAQDTLKFLPGVRFVGRIYGLSPEDPIDPTRLNDADRMANVFEYFDEGGTVDPDSLNILGRERQRDDEEPDMICTRKVCGKPDTTTFALTDDMLSDLTGSIHGAVMDTETGLRRGDPAGGRVVWAAPFGGARDQNGRGDVANATHYFGGGMLGMSWGAKDVRVGGFIGGSVGQLAGGKYQGNQTTDVDMQTLFFGLAASRALGDVLYDARLLVGSLTHDSTRTIPGVDTPEGNYSSVFFSPEVGVAATLTLTDTLEARPRVRVRYAGLFTEGFQERGQMTGWDMEFAERTLHLVEARAEVGIPFALANGGRITPRVGVEGRYLLAGSEIGVVDSGKMVSYDAGGDAGVITGTVGLGMAVPVAEAMTLVGSFDGALTTEDAWRALGYLGLTWSF